MSCSARFTRSCACGARESRCRGKTKRSPARDGLLALTLPVGRTIPIRGKKVTPTVAAGSARAPREVDADDHGEGGDGRRASHAARGTPRARPARHQRATARSCRSREKNSARRARIPVRQKSHINSPTRNFAGSSATPRRESRRAAAGVHSCHVDARVTRRARRAWGVLARPRGGSGVPRAASGE